MRARRFLVWFFSLVILLGAAFLFLPSVDQLVYQYAPRWYRYVAPSYEYAPPSKPVEYGKVEPPCPDEFPEWRKEQVVDGVKVEEDPSCTPDNPAEVAAFVRGTNNVSHATLMKSGLSMDAVVLENDRDGDGDPDDITIRLEVAELNGRSPDVPFPVPAYFIAPGIQPGFWVFAPKTHGMVTKNFVDYEVNPLIRVPSPTVRVEQGDHVKIILENTHYIPHTIHLHGVDHPYYLDHPVHGEPRGNDGVPETSHTPVMPGESFTYEITPRVAGSMLYHCHEQPPVHQRMGLFGGFVIEENRPNNWPQTLNVGGGKIRHPSVAVKEKYAGEYDLLYQEVDTKVNDIIKQSNDPRPIARATTRLYQGHIADPDYFLLNGKSFPNTLRDSQIIVEENKKYKLRMFNIGDDRDTAIHTHGHKLAITHYDGVPHNPEAWITRDVFHLAPGQRIDLELDTTNDGLHSYGPGVWMFHDHKETAILTNGQFPGGNVSLITYKPFLGPSGLPKTHGVDLAPFFTKEFYERKFPVWTTYDKEGRLADPGTVGPALTRPLVLAFLAGLLIAGIVLFTRTGVKKGPVEVSK